MIAFAIGLVVGTVVGVLLTGFGTYIAASIIVRRRNDAEKKT
jgi:hypothetical protein